MKFHATIFVLNFLGVVAQSHQDFYNDLAVICKSNGMVYVTVATNYNTSFDDVTKALMAFENAGLRSRSLNLDQVWPNLIFELDTLMLIAPSDILFDSVDFMEYLTLISQTKVKKSILVLTGEVTSTHEDYMSAQMGDFARNSLFYVAHESSNKVF
jgi:ribonucleotide monophosphatase NagD (HAD superfamily)